MFEEEIRAAELALAEAEGLAPDDPVRLRCLNDLSFALRITDARRGFGIGAEAARLAELRGHLPELAWALRNQTFMGALNPDVATTVEIAKRALAIFRHLGDVSGQAAVEDRLATLYERAGDYTAALRYATSSLDKARALDDRPRVGWALSSLGGIQAALGEDEPAQRFYEEARQVFWELQNPVGVFRLTWRLTALHRERGRPEIAHELAVECQRMAAEADSSLPRVASNLDLGRCLEALGRDDEARTLLEETLHEMPPEFEWTVGPEVRCALGRIYIRARRFDAAREQLQTAVEVAERTGVTPLALQVRELFATIEEESGRPAEALMHLRRADEHRAKVFDLETRKTIARESMRSELEAAQKDAEIHRLKYVELERMQAQLVETERLALLGDIAAGIAHEANTPLGVVRSNLQIFERIAVRLDGGSTARLAGATEARDPQAMRSAFDSALATTREAVDRIEQLVTSLRRFARLDEAEYQAVDVRDGLRSVVELFATDLPESVRLETTWGEVPSFWGWPGELNQAFLALLNHARHAVDRGGVISLETGTRDGEVWVRVADDGPAIPEVELGTLFEPGFGSRDRRVRFRLGLASVASVVRKHGGRIEVKSDERGTRFELRFPTEPAPGRRG